MKEVILRPFSKKDAPQVKKAALASWSFTYKDIFSETIIRDFVNTNYNIDLLCNIEKWVAKGFTKFVVAENKNEILGFAQIGFENYWNQTIIRDKCRIKLFRIYLVPEYLGKGIGKRLWASMEEFVLQNGKFNYYLSVHKENQIGLKFYRKNGFKIKKDDVIAMEYEMEKNLNEA